MVDKEDLVCCHFDVPPLEEFEEEYDDMSKPDDMVDKPIVETVGEEFPTKYVFDKSEELFPSKVFHVKANIIDCVMDAPLDSIDTMFDTPQGQSTTKVEHNNHNNNLETPGGVSETLRPDYIHFEY